MEYAISSVLPTPQHIPRTELLCSTTHNLQSPSDRSNNHSISTSPPRGAGIAARRPSLNSAAIFGPGERSLRGESLSAGESFPQDSIWLSAVLIFILFSLQPPPARFMRCHLPVMTSICPAAAAESADTAGSMSHGCCGTPFSKSRHL